MQIVHLVAVAYVACVVLLYEPRTFVVSAVSVVYFTTSLFAFDKFLKIFQQQQQEH